MSAKDLVINSPTYIIAARNTANQAMTYQCNTICEAMLLYNGNQTFRFDSRAAARRTMVNMQKRYLGLKAWQIEKTPLYL